MNAYYFLYLFLFLTVPEEQKPLSLVEKIFLEEDSFHSLKGTLYLPYNGKPDKIVIFIASIQYEVEANFEKSEHPLLMQYIQNMLSNKVGLRMYYFCSQSIDFI